MSNLDQALFNAWQSGDKDARNDAWTSLWSKLYTMAVRLCAKICRHPDSEGCGAEAFLKTFEKVDEDLASGHIDWREAESFVAYFRKLLTWRVRDECRRSWSRQNDENEDALTMVTDSRRSPEESAAKLDNKRMILQRLVAMRTQLSARNRMRIQILLAIEDYARDYQDDLIPAGVNVDELTFSDILKILDKQEVKSYVSRRFGIEINPVEQHFTEINQNSVSRRNNKQGIVARIIENRERVSAKKEIPAQILQAVEDYARVYQVDLFPIDSDVNSLTLVEIVRILDESAVKSFIDRKTGISSGQIGQHLTEISREFF